ncbi:phosphoribosylglycinamide formyltransferase [Fibrobacterales bacterium]|nr:phosphoribosylglycinamide formyltransferase [Fibrobacterales bacterium]
MPRFSMLSAGRGSNFLNIINRIADGSLPAECCSLLSYNENCGAMEIAKQNFIPTRLISDTNLIPTLLQDAPDLIVMSGYMRKLPEEIFVYFENKIINIHPSLLPSFGGKGCFGIHTHEKVLAAGVKITGVTVHYVTKDYDAGKIIAQSAVPVFDGDTPHSLADRVLQEEHALYWKVIRDLLNLF